MCMTFCDNGGVCVYRLVGEGVELVATASRRGAHGGAKIRVAGGGTGEPVGMGLSACCDPAIGRSGAPLSRQDFRDGCRVRLKDSGINDGKD